MYLTIDYNSGVSVSAQIIAQVKYLVVRGELQPGERIPSVRGLASQMKLNPTTVARIYRQLEAEEIIFTKPGSGAFIAHGPTGLTRAEKRRRLTAKARELVVESGRIGFDYPDLLKLIESEIRKIDKKETNR
jgi:GntR family transcriptional regulator